MSSEILAEGLVFPEGPRWHEGRLWFSDMEDCRVKAVDLSGRMDEIIVLNDYPSGLGWLPDGTLLIVSMKERKLLALDGKGKLRVHADLSDHSISYANDMVVDRIGRAYVGSMGYDIWADPDPKPGMLACVSPEGHPSVAAEQMMFPNGSVITPDGRTLIVAESLAKQLTAFDIAEHGGLSNRRLWAKTADAMPDGICLDAAGGIWVATIETGSFMRIEQGGAVTDLIETPPGRQGWAVALGGDDGRTLFMLTSSPLGDLRENRLQTRPGRVEILKVDVPGADWC